MEGPERKKETYRSSFVLLSWLDIFHSVLIKCFTYAQINIFKNIKSDQQIRHFLSCALFDRSAHGVQNPVHFKSRCSSGHRALGSQSTCTPSALSVTLSSVSTVPNLIRIRSKLFTPLCGSDDIPLRSSQIDLSTSNEIATSKIRSGSLLRNHFANGTKRKLTFDVTDVTLAPFSGLAASN